MRLQHWTFRKKDVEFDPQSGTAVVVKRKQPRPESSSCPGFAASERKLFGRKEFYAVFNNQTGVIFYAGKQHWQLGDSKVNLCHRRLAPFISRFSVQVSGVEEYSVTYTHIGRLFIMFIDATYDQIDQDSDFFLEFIADHGASPDWLKHIQKNWHEHTST